MVVDTQETPTTGERRLPEQWTRLRRRVVRSSDDRAISGLAAGLASRIGIGAAYARAAFVVLSFTGGVGVVLYGVGWAISSETVSTRRVESDLETRQYAGLALLFLGAMMALRGLDLWLGDAVVWSATLVSFGIAAIWDRSDSDATHAFSGAAPGRARIVVGAALMLAGLTTFSGSLQTMQQLGPIVIAVGITAAGFMLIFGPWVARLAGDLATERRDRIRSEERSEMAAHLHDSVLQTLALIQRSDDPKKMTTLARTQERELRTWLYGRDRGVDDETLAEALEAAATRVERAHDVPVEVIVVNDVAVAGVIDAVVKSASEAMNNAARHSGASLVSVYAETMNGTLDVYITDQGRGFDPEDLPEDRHGVRESIRGRMERHGGKAEIHSEPGEGTEVHLEMPLEVAG